MRLARLSYCEDSADRLAEILKLSGAVFLDSGQPYGAQGRFDIITACPYRLLTTHGPITTVQTENSSILEYGDPFFVLKKYLAAATFSLPEIDLPFIGGAVGYFAYDLARRLERLPALAQHDLEIPDMVVGIYDWAIIIDHLQRQAWLLQQGNSPSTAAICAKVSELWQRRENTASPTDFQLQQELRSNFTASSYAKAFSRIQYYLQNGDIYQVNLAQRFSAAVSGSPWSLYKTLRQHNPAPFSAYLNTAAAKVLCLSPERFLQVRDQIVESKPIKGTRPRAAQAEKDTALAQELLNSAKDRAENLMIVDLLRNDLSKCCIPGTVKVPHLFALESFKAVHHLVSTVKGQLRADKQPLDLLRDCFPGGSITGAPKLRAMSIIEELEPHRRNLYCGTVSYIGFDGQMDSNIVIRTLLWHQQHIYCHAGGAITIASELDEEYAETFAKIKIILQLLNEFKK